MSTTLPSPEAAKAKKPDRPREALPTNRLAFKKQLDVLRAVVAVSKNGTVPATNEAVAAVAGITADTVSLNNRFLAEIGLVVGGIPCAEVLELARAHQWNPERAASKLAPILRESWFGAALLPQLSFSPVDENRAIEILAEKAHAGPDYRPQLRILLEYLVAAELIVFDGNLVKAVHTSTHQHEPAKKESAPTGPISTATAPTGPTGPIGSSTRDGIINFHIDLRIEMAEVVKWPPEKITAFFAGIAQVMAAKAPDKDLGG